MTEQETMPRRGTDWEAQLTKTEKGKIEGKDVVFLRGLQRLAELAGIKRSDCTVMAPSPKLIQCVYTAEFDDGTQWVGTGDCGPANSKPPFLNFPTSIAESRAEARCLKKALGIRLLSAEEIGMAESFTSLEAAPTNEIDDSIVKAIESLCSTRNIDPVEVVESVVSDQERAMNISELKHLTAAEGQAAMAWLNEQKPRAAKAGSKRTARKKELEEKLQ